MKTIVIISAVEKEIEIIISSFSLLKVDCGIYPIYKGSFKNYQIYAIYSGVGKANASACAAVVAERYKPDLIVSIGSAGAYVESQLSIGDVVLVDTEYFGDEGAKLRDNFLSLEDINLPLYKKNGEILFNKIPLSNIVIENIVRSYKGLHVGGSVTVSSCSGYEELGSFYYRAYNKPLCENMEGAAVSLLAYRYNIDCIEIRGISNLVLNRDKDSWNFDIALENSQKTIINFIRLCLV